MECFMKKEDKSLIDVENVVTTGKRCCSELTNTIQQFMVYVHRNEAYFTYIFMYIIPMYLRLTTFTKTLTQMPFHLYFLAIFILFWGATHDSADCWSAHRSPASNVCTTNARLGGVGRVPPPQQKSWLRRWVDRESRCPEEEVDGVWPRINDATGRV